MRHPTTEERQPTSERPYMPPGPEPVKVIVAGGGGVRQAQNRVDGAYREGPGNQEGEGDDGEEDDELEDEEEDDLKKPEKKTTPDDLYDRAKGNSEAESNGGHGGGHGHGGGGNDGVPKGAADLLWLAACFFGIMMSFICYGLLLEYTTSGGRKLHELSFLFVTSLLYTITGAAGRYVRDEKPSTIPPARFAILGLTSMGSTYCSVRSLRYVIFPIQVLAKSCKPVPVMIMGAFMGKKYPLRKYINVTLIVMGVGLFMGGGDTSNKHKSGGDDSGLSNMGQIAGIALLFVSLCFDGATGAYEDKLMAVHHVGPFDLMYNIQLVKTIMAGVGLLVFNQVHIFLQMCQDMGLLLVALGLSGAMGQVFIFVTIAKFGALTCSIIGLARKVTTLVASIIIYGHHLNGIQTTGLVISVGAMVMNFWGKKGKKGGGHGGHGEAPKEMKPAESEEFQKMLAPPGGYFDQPPGSASRNDGSGDVEMAETKASDAR